MTLQLRSPGGAEPVALRSTCILFQFRPRRTLLLLLFIAVFVQRGHKDRPLIFAAHSYLQRSHYNTPIKFRLTVYVNWQ